LPTQYDQTEADRAAWARLWDMAREPWDRVQGLADYVGVSRTTVVEWCPGGRHPGSGPWCLLRRALRRTAQLYPAAVPRLVEGLIAELLDVHGRWVPTALDDVGDYRDESGDVSIALGRLTEAVRAGDVATIQACARALVNESEEAAQSAVVNLHR